MRGGYLGDTRWIWSRPRAAVRLCAAPGHRDALTPVRSGAGRPGAALLPPSSINHGLSVFTHADAVAAAATTGNRRRRWPVVDDRTFPISNCFNDATSGAFYPGHRSGPEGLDFACAGGTPVHAMYGGGGGRDRGPRQRTLWPVRHPPFRHGPGLQFRVPAHLCPLGRGGRCRRATCGSCKQRPTAGGGPAPGGGA